MKIILVVIILSALLLVACATKPPEIVKVPVMVKCPIAIPPEPHYPIADLKRGDTPDTVVKSYVATVKLQQIHINDITTRMRVCNA